MDKIRMNEINDKLTKIDQRLELWYDKPALDWETQVLPIGNAHLGMTISGGINQETLVLNEKTLWTGGPAPSRPNYRGGNKQENTYEYTKMVRQALFDGDYETAISLTPKLTGESGGYGAYQLLGNLILDMEVVNECEVTDYRRYLNLNESIAGVSYVCNGVTYTREYFANYPSRIIAVKLTADQEGAISFAATFSGTQEGATRKAVHNVLECAGAIVDNGLRYDAKITFKVSGGDLIPDGEQMLVKNANEVILMYAAATDYANVYPTYRSGKDPKVLVDELMRTVLDKGYDTLKKEHILDYQELFHRADVKLCDSFPKVTTDVLLKEYKNRTESSVGNANDRYLEHLYFQYGRYLLISSSREGTLPANLQGVWNETNNPPWACDYHINVNLQMNYWPAFVTNLSETAKPLVEYVDSLREPGRVTAKEYYGIITDEDHPENGWIAHTQSTPFGWTCPGWDFNWGWSSAACAWLDQNLWEYYEFTGDQEYLRSAIYPILRESVMFYTQELIYDSKQDRLVSSPSYSPEHGPVTIGNTYEQSLIEQLFHDFITASTILSCDEELRTKVEQMVTMLKPYSISEKTGCLKEWFDEDEENFDWSQVDPHHRHTSHLLGLYPGKMINYNTPELLAAAGKSLNSRGDAGTGWGIAMKALTWCRSGEAQRAYHLFRILLKHCTNDNLWDMCPPFQIDGNFGGTSSVAEMLIQSHMDYIQVLPALPTEWKDGSFYGLCARNGFELEASWTDSKLVSLSVLSKNGADCRIKIEGAVVMTAKGEEVASLTQDGILSFQTKKGEKYGIISL